jgi:tetratricopeptide (TPR) repeat protein
MFRRAVVELATLYEESRRYEDAVSLLKPVVARDPDYREARLTLAKTHIQMNNSDEAIDLLKEHATNDAIALSLIGAAHLQKNQPAEACGYLESALKLNRSLIDARVNLAHVYTLLGDHARAERHRLYVTARESRLG